MRLILVLLLLVVVASARCSARSTTRRQRSISTSCRSAFRWASPCWSRCSPAWLLGGLVAWSRPRARCAGNCARQRRTLLQPAHAATGGDAMNELALLFLLLPVAALSGWVLGRRGSERTLRRARQRAVDQLLPRPQLPAQRAAGQGDRGLPQARRGQPRHGRNAPRARQPVPPPRRGRSRDPRAPAPDRAAEPQPGGKDRRAARARRGLHARRPARSRRNAVHRSRRDGRAGAVGAAST